MGRYAILLNADTDQIGPAANGLMYALDFDDEGHEMNVFLNGAATMRIPELKADAANPVQKYYADVRERSLLAGMCGYCADTFDVHKGVDDAVVALVGGRAAHGQDVGDLVDRDFELLTVR